MFGCSGLQKQQGVHRHPGAAAVHSQRLLEDDLGAESERHRHGDQLRRSGSGEFAKKDLQSQTTGKILKTCSLVFCSLLGFCGVLSKGVVLIYHLLRFYSYDTEQLLFVYFLFQTKCEKYWPEAGESALYGELQVTAGFDLKNPFWTLREFNIKHV